MAAIAELESRAEPLARSGVLLLRLIEAQRGRWKLWLAPIIVVLVGFGALLIVAQGSVVAPFIYTLF